MGWRDTIAPDTPRKDREYGKDDPSNWGDSSYSSDSSGGVALESRADAVPDSHAEARRQRARAMLAEQPGMRYVMVTDDSDPTYPAYVVLCIGIRFEDGSEATADLLILKTRYDAFALLELVEYHGRRTDCSTPS